MATRVFHPCQFGFANQDIRVDGAAISGGVSISGYEDAVRTDGGGFWRADFSDADFGDRDAIGRAETLTWRALNAGMLGGSVAIDVSFCDPLHQPGDGFHEVPHSDQTSFSDDALYQGGGASSTVLSVVNGQAGGLRATVLDISGKNLIGGERFTLVHPEWGPRAYEVYDVEDIDGGQRITFQPPIRGGVGVGDDVDFANIRCRMRRSSPPSNPLNMGAFSSASISFQEDMRPPA